VLCPLDRITTVITDEGIPDKAAAMLDAADVTLIVAQPGAAQEGEAVS
jgi:DeoR family ulaG and ulaABCDEF operon transcriptional repressor